MKTNLNNFEDVSLMRLIRNSTKTSEQILNQLKFLRDIVDKLNIAIFIHDLIKLRHIWTNNNYVNIIGYTDEEIKSFGPEWAKDNYHPDDFHILKDRIEFFEQNKGDTYSGIYRVKHKQGYWVWIYSNSTVYKRDETGIPKQIIGICIDFASSFKTEKSFDEFYHESHRQRYATQITNLTQRELQIIHHISDGKTCQQIGSLLNISSHTVNNHRKHLLKKLHLKNIADLAHFASKTGLD